MGLNRRKLVLIGICLVSATFLLICRGHAQGGKKLLVFVSIPPQEYFLHQIGKQRVEVQVMVQPGASPATYEPKPRQMAAISRTHIYFAIGVPFEKIWLKKIAAANPDMQVVHTDHGIQKIPMAANHAESEQHREENQHGESDPHIWLSPSLVMIQARTILNALVEIDPDHRAVYETNTKVFLSKLEALDADLKNMFAGKQGFQFMVFHPSWGYFARSYGLQQVPIEIEGKDPKPAQLKELIEHAKKKHINVIFVQPQFSSRSAELVAKEIGGQVIVADPLASDWSGNLREVAQKFKVALQ
ncbi:MAG: zinc ABC transporter substrate-binding protein [Desulfobacteraceae bacterium]|jgi:zinc transport system substrate-binding protein|nr:zinc ABC transporter substrate-binding protein [Desulfobacteraceae bacterium]